MRGGMLGVICRSRYFRVGPFILAGVVGKNKKSLIWKAFVQETLQKTSESKAFLAQEESKEGS